jgi:hypothetical protein
MPWSVQTVKIRRKISRTKTIQIRKMDADWPKTTRIWRMDDEWTKTSQFGSLTVIETILWSIQYVEKQ